MIRTINVPAWKSECLLSAECTQLRIPVEPWPAAILSTGEPVRLTWWLKYIPIPCPVGEVGSVIQMRSMHTMLGHGGFTAHFLLPGIPFRVVSLHVERLHEITREDIVAEGFRPTVGMDGSAEFLGRQWFEAHWNRTHGRRHRWGRNCFVWVVGVERVET